MLDNNLIAALERYVTQGIPTGDFLRAVLANDLVGACGRADLDNQKRIFEIVSYIYNNLPSACWGSYRIVDAWMAHVAALDKKDDHLISERKQPMENL